jgi:hypothetical protein
MHPIVSFKVKKHLKETYVIYNSVKASKLLDGLESGGKLDAFRHCFAMAYLSRYVSVVKLRSLGIAHEKGNKLNFYKNLQEYSERADSLLCEMDLRNNEVGFTIGIGHKMESVEELKQLIINEIKSGKAWYLKRNSNNEYVTCEGDLIKIENYKNQWFIPKCLIASNQ